MTIGDTHNAALPSGGQPTSAKPRELYGYIWRCYAIGIMKTEWRTDGGRWAVGQLDLGGMWWARVNGDYLVRTGERRTRRFRKMETACKAAVES